MDIPTAKDQAASSGHKNVPMKSSEELLNEMIKEMISKISLVNPTAKRVFVGAIPGSVINAVVDAGYDVDYECSYTIVDGVASTLKITNPVFKAKQDEEDQKIKEKLGKAVGNLFRNMDTDPTTKQYYDIFAGFMNQN